MNRCAHQQPARGGAALLLVLTLILIISSSLSVALLQWQRAHAVQLASDEEQVLHALLRDSIMFAAHALEARQAQHALVTPADEQVHAIPLTHDHVQLAGGTAVLRISAYDARAALPVTAAQTPHALHATLPDALRTLPIVHDAQAPVRSWLDSSLSTLATRFPDRHAALPPAQWQDLDAKAGSQTFTAGAVDNTHASDASAATIFDHSAPALAVYVNPWQDDAININTAPLPLLQALYKSIERNDALEELIEARAQGTHSTDVPALPAGKQLPLKLVSESTLFTLHISVHYRGIRRNYIVCLQTGSSMNIKQILLLDEVPQTG